jgi:hypothetical protein
MLEVPGRDHVYVKIMQVVDESVVMGMERERTMGPRAWDEAFYCLGTYIDWICSDRLLGTQFGWVGVVYLQVLCQSGKIHIPCLNVIRRA